MKRKASQASLSEHESDKEERKPRMQLEAMAQAAMMDGLSKAQVVYEQWVDTQPIEEVTPWDEMEEDAKKEWCVEHGVGYQEVGVVSLSDEGLIELERERNEGVMGIEEAEKIEEEERVEEDDSGKEEEMVVQFPEEETTEEAVVGDMGDDSKWIAVRVMCNEQSAEETLVVEEQEASLVTSAGMFSFLSRNLHCKWETVFPLFLNILLLT